MTLGTSTTFPLRRDDDPTVELLLCAAALARDGAQLALVEATSALGLEWTDLALHAALATRRLYPDGELSADQFLETAYQLGECRL